MTLIIICIERLAFGFCMRPPLANGLGMFGRYDR